MPDLTFSEIAHAHHTFLSPLSSARAGLLVSLLDLPRGGAAVDICSGPAELLIRIVERYGVAARAIDISGAYLAEAAVRAAQRLPPDSLELIQADAAGVSLEAESFDLAMWIGGADAIGGFGDVVTRLRSCLRPGGVALMGDLFWRREPPAEQVSVFFYGDGPGRLESHGGKVRAIRAGGLSLLYAATANEEEWDEYEGRCLSAIERWAAANPGDPRREQFGARARASYDEYLAWRRDSLGFGFYLARRD